MLKKFSHTDANFCFDISDTRLNVPEISHGVAPSGAQSAILIRDEFHLQFAFGGTALYDGKTVCAGNVFLMDPVTPHKIVVTSDEPFEQYWIKFSGSDAEKLLLQTEIGTVSRILTYPDIERFRAPLYDAVYGDTPQCLLALKFTGLLTWLLSYFNPSEARAASALTTSEFYVRGAMEFLRNGCQHGATIAEAAEYVGVTEKYLCRLFRLQNGITPMRFLSHYRAERAMELLRNTDFTISEIARMVGFDDQTYFSRFFRSTTGTPPSEYRRNCRQIKAK